MTNGAQISFIRSGSVVLTRVCSQACSYCAFRSSEENVLSVANLHENLYRIRKSGATEAVFICGDSPQEYPLTLVALKKEGFSSFADYLEHSCKLALTYELLPVLSVGALDLFASKKLAHVAALIRIPVFSSDLFGAGKAHENSRRRTFGNAKIAI
ncbi:hypothetical protein HYY75_10820 [bacterium]|nr:hypothetical protein [bacterium]